MEEVKLIFSGKVQGVGFRAQVVECAEMLGIKGTAKNLLDGSVEVLAQAEPEVLDEFILALKEDPGMARIDKITKESGPATKKFQDFRIIF